MKIKTILFTEKHLQSFRFYSKDENPLHTNEEYASRTPFSDRVFYGMASVFFLLSKSKINQIDIKSLKIDFKKPIMLNKTYNFLTDNKGSKYFLKIFKGNSIYTKIKIELLNSEEQKNLNFSLNSINSDRLLDKNPNWNTLSEDKKKKEILENYSGIENINDWLLKILAWSSYWVGMIAPGRQAIFTQFELIIKNNDLNFYYQNNKFHDLLKRHKSYFKTNSGSSITMISFSRPLPVDYLEDHFFNDKNALLKNEVCLITGGTRGVGSVFSQLFASKNATCYASYFRNDTAAKKIEKFIQSKKKSFKVIKFNNKKKFIDNLKAKKLDCLILNSAPAIKKIDPSELSEKDFENEFNQFYNLTMREINFFKNYLEKNTTIINISTTYIEDKPYGFAHYYKAKKAIENELLKFSKKYPNYTILNFRLPKMHTDQTNTNDISDLSVSPVRVAALVFKNFLDKRNHPGFYTIQYDEKKFVKSNKLY
jgi:short-subunit dehydrogenase involved in D-alanine esterification of teichoic acids